MIRTIGPIVSFCLMLAILTFAGCSGLDNIERHLYSPSSFAAASDSLRMALNDDAPYIKLHMKNGTLALMNQWSSAGSRSIIDGSGVLFSPMRDTISAGPLAIGLDSVSIVETNQLSYSGTRAAITVFMGVSGAIAAYCVFNPKACFGSCPTFYVNGVDSLRPRAEGFSASVAPSLEATDCDALGDVPLASNEVTIEMRNEALETHVVRSVALLAVPRRTGTTIYKDAQGSFHECTDLRPPVRARAEEGDCLSLIASADARERTSRADSADLAAKETIDLEFDPSDADSSGLVIGCRQSLMTTFLFYKTLGYMGREAGRWFAEIERNNVNEPMNALEDLLGGIDVQMKDSTGAWNTVGTVLEYGPLATDIHLIPLPKTNGGPILIRLRLTKGYWRIDNAGIVRIHRTVEPLRITPSAVLRDGANDVVAKALLLDPTKTLVTKPGDTFQIRFDLPDRADAFEMFLESRGYYLEWMRKSWMEEEDPLALCEMFFDPASALRRLAPEFVRAESAVEAQFWRSKYAR